MDDWNCCQPSVSCSLSFERRGEKSHFGDSVVIFERSRTSTSQQHHVQLTIWAGEICPSVAWGEGWIQILLQYMFLSWEGNHFCNFILSPMHTHAPKLISFGSGLNMYQKKSWISSYLPKVGMLLSFMCRLASKSFFSSLCDFMNDEVLMPSYSPWPTCLILAYCLTQI